MIYNINGRKEISGELEVEKILKNVIEDKNYYYFFRALNRGDHNDRITGVTSEDDEIVRVRTDGARYLDAKGKVKYDSSREKSLEETWDHVRYNHSVQTNCISLSRSSNVVVSYGGFYHHEYVMVKVPKKGDNGKVYDAAGYILEEIEKKIKDVVKSLPKDSEILKFIKSIDDAKDSNEVRSVLSSSYKKVSSLGTYTLSDESRNKKLMSYATVTSRLKNKQYLNDSEQLRYNKTIAKLTCLELYKKIGSILPNLSDNKSLISALNLAYSSSEYIHYGEMAKEEFVEVKREMMDLLSLLQQLKENNNISNSDELESKLITYINQGYKFGQENGKTILKSKNIEDVIEIEDIDYKVISSEFDEIKSELSIEDIYKMTNGRIEYQKAKRVIEFAQKLRLSRQKVYEYIKVINAILTDDSTKGEIERKLLEDGFIIDKDIITRVNNEGVNLTEGVSIGISSQVNKFVSQKEQFDIINKIKQLDYNGLNDLEKSFGQDEQIKFFENVLDLHEEISENEYFANAIIDGLDLSKIYKTLDENIREFTQEEREKVLLGLKEADCKRLYNSFINAGLEENDISSYIINLLIHNGYQGKTLAELSRVDDLDEIIRVNVDNKFLKPRVSAVTLDRYIGIKDNDYPVPGSNIKLREYQQKTVDKLDEIYKEKRFAGVVLPTGAGKSFVAITEMLKRSNQNIVYIAPQTEILNQVCRHIVKHVLGRKDVKEEDMKKVVEEAFPHLKMFCYKSLENKDFDVSKLDADFVVLDELHRAGAREWRGRVKELIEKNPRAQILGITATPIRDDNNEDMMKTIAEFSGDYTKEEIIQEKKHLAVEMTLVEAMQKNYVVEPKIISFNYTLLLTEQFKEIERMIESETNRTKRNELIKKRNEMVAIATNTDIDKINVIQEKIKKGEKLTEEEKYEYDKFRTSELINSDYEGLSEVFEQYMVGNKKDGKYIVFLPQNRTGLDSEKYVLDSIEKVKDLLKGVDESPEIGYLLSNREDKKKNISDISNFEKERNGKLKLLFAINKLNEGVHVDDVTGEIMLRKIGSTSNILYLQQIGRVIYSIDPDNQPDEENLPIIFDVYNNYLTQNLDREANKTSPRSDLERLKSIVTWMERHNTIPDINSEIISEARKAIALKKIQEKYTHYEGDFDKDNLSKNELREIEEILDIARQIGLFHMELGERIVPPGEKEIGRVNAFKVTGNQKRFLDIYKSARALSKAKIDESPSIMLNDIISVLSVLHENGVEITRRRIGYGSITVEKFINENFKTKDREKVLSQLDVDKSFDLYDAKRKLLRTYNDKKNNELFLQYDIVDLRRLGIFDLVEALDDRGFIKNGPEKFIGINAKTGTRYDENGYDINGVDELNFEINKTTNKYNFYRNHMHINGTHLDDNQFDIYGDYWILEENGGYYNTYSKLNEYGFDRDGYYWEKNEEGKYFNTLKKQDPLGFKLGETVNEFGFKRNGLTENGARLNKYNFDKDGYYWDYNNNGDLANTGKKVNKFGFNMQGFFCIENGDELVVTDKKVDQRGFNIDGINQSTHRKTDSRDFDQRGFFYKYTENGYECTYLKYDRFGFDVDGYYWEKSENGIMHKTDRKVNSKNFDANGIYWKMNESGELVSTGSIYNENRINFYGDEAEINENGFDEYGWYWRKIGDDKYEFTNSKFNEDGFDRYGRYKNGGLVDERGFDSKKRFVNRNGKFKYDNNGFDFDGNPVEIDEHGFDDEGMYWKQDENKRTRWRDLDEYGFDKAGFYWSEQTKKNSFPSKEDRINTGKKYSTRGFNRDGFFVRVKKSGEVIVTEKRYDLNHFDRDGFLWKKNEDGIFVKTDLRINGRGFSADGLWWRTNSIGEPVKTSSKYDAYGYNIKGLATDGCDARGLSKKDKQITIITDVNERGFSLKTDYYQNSKMKYSPIDGLDKDGFDEFGFDKNGIHRITKTKFNERGLDRYGFNEKGIYCEINNGKVKQTKSTYNLYGFNSKGIHKNGTLYDDNGFKIDGTREDGSKYDAEGYNLEGFDKNGFNRSGFYRNTNKTLNEFGFDKNGIHNKTKLPYDSNGFMIDGKNIITGSYVSIYGCRINGTFSENGGRNFNERLFDKDGDYLVVSTNKYSRWTKKGKYDKYGFNIFGIDKNGFGADKSGKKSTGMSHPRVRFTRFFLNQIFAYNWNSNDMINYLVEKYKYTPEEAKQYISETMEITFIGYPNIKKEIDSYITKVSEKIKEDSAELDRLKAENGAKKEKIEEMERYIKESKDKMARFNKLGENRYEK